MLAKQVLVIYLCECLLVTAILSGRAVRCFIEAVSLLQSLYFVPSPLTSLTASQVNYVGVHSPGGVLASIGLGQLKVLLRYRQHMSTIFLIIEGLLPHRLVRPAVRQAFWYSVVVHVTIWFHVRYFLLVVFRKQASISNGFRDIQRDITQWLAWPWYDL